MNQTFIYWIAFLSYSGLVVGIGYYFYLRRKRQEDVLDNQNFWAAGKNLSGWASGLSISASMMSISWSCVYGVQLFYWYGIGAAWLLIIPWLLTMSGFYMFAPLFRGQKAFSQPELLAKRFGNRSRKFLAPALIFVFIVWAGAEIWAAGKIISPFLGISTNWTILLIAVVVALYSFTGGFEAVVSTDKIQFALVAMFISIMAIIGYSAVSSNPANISLFDAGFIAPKSQPGTPWFLSPGFALIALTFFAYLPGWIVETDIWIRLQAARSDAEARKGILIASVNSLIFVGILPLIVGLSALILYPPIDGQAPQHLEDGALIFTALMQDYTPVWLSIFLGIGLVAAAMSTVDTCGNVVALSISYDLLEPRLKQKWPAKKLDVLARWISVAAIFFAYVYALFTDSLWDIFYLSSGILTTTVFIPVIAVFLPNSTSKQVNFSILFGFAGTLIFYFMESRGFLQAIEPQWFVDTQVGYILWGFLCGLLGFLIGRNSRRK